NENYDDGKIIFQERVEVLPGDDAESLQKKVLKLEHKFYAQVISEIERGKVL
ncbi:MAG: formyltransferase family protein, partial [Ignavibacteria bacterium]